MRNKAKVFLSILLVFAMVAGLLPLPAVKRTVQAAGENGTGKAIQLVKNGSAPNITGAQTSIVYFGKYRQNSTNTNKTRVKWKVLENTNGQLFLLSEQNLDVFRYHDDGGVSGVNWKGCTMRSWLNGYGAEENIKSVDYSNSNFIDNAFNEKEQAAVATTHLVKPVLDSTLGLLSEEDTDDQIFLLSEDDVINSQYGFALTAQNELGGYAAHESRKSLNTDYVAKGGTLQAGNKKPAGEADTWWLRSPGTTNNSKTVVREDGEVNKNYMLNSMGSSYTVRPAFKLDLNKVLFTSAPSNQSGEPGGKEAKRDETGLVSVGNYTGNTWKLTLLDARRSGFKASYKSRNGDAITIDYSGAVTGTNEYISAIITDVSGAVTYYGRIEKLTGAALASGSVTIDVSGKMNAGDRLYVFNEQHNATYSKYFTQDVETDYASNLQKIAPVVIDSVALTMGDRIDANIYLKVPEGATKAEITYSYPGWKVPELQEYVFSNMNPDSQGRYQLDVINIPAKELIETMTLRVYDRNGNLIPLSMQTAVGRMTDANTYVFSSADYANVVVAKGNEQQRKQAKALLNYGSMVQWVLSHKTETLAASAAILTEMATEMNAIQVNHNYDGVLPTGTVKENLGYQSLSLNLEGEIQILLSFSKKVTATMNGKALQVQRNDSSSSYEVVIPHIRAKNMDIIHEVEVSYGTTRFTFKVCALTYANRILATANVPQPYTNLAKAMYIYQKETLALFGR